MDKLDELYDLAQGPPIRAMPRWRWDELHPIWTYEAAFYRMSHLDVAGARYLQAKRSPLPEWLNERNEIYARLKNETRWYCDPMRIMALPILLPLFKIFGFCGYRLPSMSELAEEKC